MAIKDAPLVLLILDGVGSFKPYKGNAVALADTPFLQHAWSAYPHTLLYASAEYVGLPANVKGNSEVGHTNIGAGRIVYQNLPRINKSIANGSFFSNKLLLDAINKALQGDKRIHLMGCLSDGDVHSSIYHLEAFLQLFSKYKSRGLNVFVHAFTDGRDSEPTSASRYFKMLDSWFKKYEIGQLATIIGRQSAMDRNNLWDRTKKAYNLLTSCKGQVVDSWQTALQISYKEGKTDEFLLPFVIKSDKDVCIKDGDVVIFFNIRPDRAVQLTKAFVEPGFDSFVQEKRPKVSEFLTMVRYAKDLNVKVLFPPNDVVMPLGQVISLTDRRQLRLAESQKYPHVTYFFNGGVNILYKGEDRIRIPSPDVPTFDLKPEMSIYEVTEVFKSKINQNLYDFYVINFANGDMVGHTGNLQAGIKAMEHVDKCTSEVVKYTLAHNGTVIITADHGNVEEMINLKTGEPDTEHSIYPVPFIVVRKDLKPMVLPMGKLADIAPTILYLMKIDIPSYFTGNVLI